MKKVAFFFVICAVFIAINCSTQSTKPNENGGDDWTFDPPSSSALDPFLMNQKIGRGFNMGNALDIKFI